MEKVFNRQSMSFDVTIENESGEEFTFVVPAKFQVCPRCQGHGYHLREAIGSYGYSREEFDEAFWDEEDRQEYFTRGGKYDVVCRTCNGARVEPVFDNQQIKRKAAYDKEFEENFKLLVDMERDAARYEAEVRAERRMEAMMGGCWEPGYSDY